MKVQFLVSACLLDEDEYFFMKQIEGFKKFDEKGKPLVRLLKKDPFGLKQSGRKWHWTPKSYLEEFAVKIQFLMTACLLGGMR